MNKRALIRKIIARLTDELAVYLRAANASRAEATHEQNKARGKYDPGLVLLTMFVNLAVA